MTAPANALVPVSWGELIDKITILEIKLDRIERPDAVANVTREHALLAAAAQPVQRIAGIEQLHARLKEVNVALWEIEDAIREEEAAGRFGSRFVELARAVYTTNDRRAAIKREVNDLLGSELVEEKSYASVTPCG
jgi:hypothetical protein